MKQTAFFSRCGKMVLTLLVIMCLTICTQALLNLTHLGWITSGGSKFFGAVLLMFTKVSVIFLFSTILLVKFRVNFGFQSRIIEVVLLMSYSTGVLLFVEGPDYSYLILAYSILAIMVPINEYNKFYEWLFQRDSGFPTSYLLKHKKWPILEQKLLRILENQYEAKEEVSHYDIENNFGLSRLNQCLFVKFVRHTKSVGGLQLFVHRDVCDAPWIHTLLDHAYSYKFTSNCE